MRLRARVLGVVLAGAFGASSALAQTPPPPSSAAPPATPPRTDLEAAKDLFRKGNALLQAGDNERALEFFLRSRAVVASVPNTLNAAIALDRLGRFDEALEMYERLVTELSSSLEDDDKRAVAAAMSTLRRKVGSLDVAANVEGTLVVDGRKRGTLPLTSPVRVLPGRHVVRVLKDGYAPGEGTVEVGAGATQTVDIRLQVLAAAGRLQVKESSGKTDLEVLVDGAPVGVVPWEGTLPPGRHLVSLRSDTLGTAPTPFDVVVAQTTAATLAAQPVGPPLRVEIEPATAVLAIDGVVVGRGAWQGRLPRGTHEIRGTEEGYVAQIVKVDELTHEVVRVSLAVDESHPRWRKLEPSRLRVEAFLGPALHGGLGGDPEKNCPSACGSRNLGVGVFLGARAAYVLPFGLRFEISGGYLSVSRSLKRTVPLGGDAVAVNDDITSSGPFAGLGVGYAHAIGRSFTVGGRATVGAEFARSRDALGGALARGAERVPIAFEDPGASDRNVDVFVAPEATATYAIGKAHVGVSLAAAIFLLQGPRLSHGAFTTTADGVAGCKAAGDLACTKGSSVLASERAYGPFVTLIPQIVGGYTF